MLMESHHRLTSLRLLALVTGAAYSASVIDSETNQLTLSGEASASSVREEALAGALMEFGIKACDIQVLAKLGEGNFGSVFRSVCTVLLALSRGC